MFSFSVINILYACQIIRILCHLYEGEDAEK